MTTAIIAEDEPHIRKQLRTLLAELWPELTVVAEAPDGVAALSVLREQAPDIAFLDVKMPGLTGVDVLQAIGATRTLVVFVTAFDTFAVSAYAEGVVDYVVKPVSASRLAKTITRLQARLAEAGTVSVGAQTQALSTTASSANSAPNAPLRWVQASQGEKVVFLTTDEILFFQSDTKYTRVVTEKRE
ncbi:MAG TPA: response regulator, partial [Casimicrobium sp.]|nr:response regulator [Casimicrobium sp.]